MENFIISKNEIEKIIVESIPVVLKEKLTSKYDSPISKAIEEELKSTEGIVRKFVRDLLVNLLNNEDFKKKIADELIAALIQKALRN